MYASFVVVLVSRQRSMVETSGFSTEIGKFEEDELLELSSPLPRESARPVLASDPIEIVTLKGSTPTRVETASGGADRIPEKRLFPVATGAQGVNQNQTRCLSL